jgi:hypothetical protein
MSRRVSVIAALVVLLAGCEPSRSAPPVVRPSLAVQTFPGGCAGTALTDAEPPVWSQGGWSVPKGAPWPVPWALGKPADAVAFLFATQLVAGASPRVDGSNNKVLWVANTNSSNFVVEGWLLNRSGPVITVQGGPSIVDVPSAGCWTFRLLWGPADYAHSSIINLQALPSGTLPSR